MTKKLFIKTRTKGGPMGKAHTEKDCRYLENLDDDRIMEKTRKQRPHIEICKECKKTEIFPEL